MNSRHYLLTPFIVLLCMLLPACWPTATAEKKLSGVVVVNVLNKKFYNDCHIKDSVHVELDQLEQWATEKVAADAELVFYCSNYMCSTSEYAAKKLKALGFKYVAVYEGGTAEWYQQGLPVEGPSKQAYLKKSMTPVAEQSGSAIPSITAQELAQKMGIAYRQPKKTDVAA